ncbi:hypothetical protein B0H13DRAFT_1881286 [Mycena leptocephala]|nr:hypothetical protein B0H13DRAFT_1881286 [Mycena leptocephala]
MVNLTAVALAGTLFSVTDFQGHVLDESFGFTADLNPVAGQVKAVPVSPVQQWSFVAASTIGQFIIQNGHSNTFLSYAGAPSGSQIYAQAVIDGSNPCTFELVLAIPSPEQFNIIAVDSGLALTAWSPSSSRGTTVTPVTYEPLQLGAVEQLWSLL